MKRAIKITLLTIHGKQYKCATQEKTNSSTIARPIKNILLNIGGSTVTLNLTKGPYLRIAGTGVEVRVVMLLCKQDKMSKA